MTLDLSIRAGGLNTGRVYTGSGKIRVGCTSGSGKIRAGVLDLAKIDPTRKPDPNPPENSGF